MLCLYCNLGRTKDNHLTNVDQTDFQQFRLRILTYFVILCNPDLLFDWFGLDQASKSVVNSASAKELNAIK